MSRRPIVLLDCDGPLADFVGGYIETLNESIDSDSRRTFSSSDVDRWHVHECDFFRDVATTLGVSTTKLRRKVEERIASPGWCSSLKPTSGAREHVETLRHISDVYIVTAPWTSSTTWMSERLSWCRRTFGIASDRVIFASQKHLIYGDVFVDDKPEHVAAWAKQWPNGKAVLFDMPHNRNAHGFERGNWNEQVTSIF